jgi:hypothetical protein
MRDERTFVLFGLVPKVPLLYLKGRVLGDVRSRFDDVRGRLDGIGTLFVAKLAGGRAPVVEVGAVDARDRL